MNIIKQIAKNNGVSAAEVEFEIQKAIIMAMNSSDEQSKENWNRVFEKGVTPSPKQFIKRLSAEIVQ